MRECPTGSGRMMNLQEVADELRARLSGIFLPDANGRGAGASHPTGWTAVAAHCIEDTARMQEAKCTGSATSHRHVAATKPVASEAVTEQPSRVH